ncbi:hypothetical protein TNCV_393151 [Trichonephila clavipes]|nr:hypothetical protein TNCV_393151 [Trichonephila clavipes]
MSPHFLFENDSATSHGTETIEELLESENIQRFDWPVGSPDLNVTRTCGFLESINNHLPCGDFDHLSNCARS